MTDTSRPTNEVWFETTPRSEGRVFSAVWGLRLPLAHPVWSEYALYLYDLTTVTNPMPVVYLPGATHEILLWALNPDRLLQRDVPWLGQNIQPLRPPNHGYQFIAPDDAAALARIQSLVDAMVDGTLSPDTDWCSVWDTLFADGASLRR